MIRFWLAVFLASLPLVTAYHGALADDTTSAGAAATAPVESPGLDPPPGDPWFAPQDAPQARRAQGSGPRLVDKDQIRPHWFAGNARFWYLNDLAGEAREFIVVDAPRGLRARHSITRGWPPRSTKALGRAVAAKRLPFDLIAFGDDGKTLRFKIDDTVWKCDLSSYECTRGAAGDAPVEAPASPRRRSRFSGEAGDAGAEARHSPDGKWMAFVKDHNVMLRNRPGGFAGGGAEP